MADREKVRKGIAICLSRFHCGEDCPYYNAGKTGCMESLQKDTLAMLKEQEPVKPVDVHMYRKMFANVRSGYCPICNNPVDEEEGNNFCCTCGRRLNWDA